MPKTERLLQIALATTAILGTFLLGMGQQNRLLPVLMLIAAPVAVFVTDIRRWFQLPRYAANVLSLAAVSFTTFDFLRQDEEFGLIAIANLLIYLQFVLLFQKKLQRTYWQLATLSLLQVVVASALNLGMEYGFLLALFGFVATGMFALFFVHRELYVYRFVIDGSPESILNENDRDGIKIWSGAGLSHRRHARRDWADIMLNRSWVRNISLIFLVTLGCTILLFFILPRLHSDPWEGRLSDDALTGFAEEVALDDIGSILESPEVVMHVWFVSPSGNHVPVHGEPYFRGKALNEYRRGRWKGDVFSKAAVALTESFSKRTVWQRIALRPQKSPILFGVSPYHLVSSQPSDIKWSPVPNVLIRGEAVDKRRSDWNQFDYTIATPLQKDGRTATVIPILASQFTPSQFRILTSGLRDFDSSEFAAIASIASSVITEEQMPIEGHYQIARTLEQYFHRPGLFKYSLDFRGRRNRGADPIVEFLTSRRQGHCEFFAGSLALMLRSQGIPSRIVLGYKGSEFNSTFKYHVVRQLHAHAWVEAFLSPDQIPPGVELPDDETVLGAWVQLDPTPMDGGLLAEDDAWAFLTTMREFRDYLQLLWNDYILGLDSKRQQEVVYGPMVAMVVSLFRQESWSYFFRDFSQRVGTGWQAFQDGGWFSWQAGLSVLTLGIVIALLYRLVFVPVMHICRRWIRFRRQRRARRLLRVDFYDQFERMLRRQGVRRLPNQTQREFVRHARHVFPAIANVPTLSAIADSFYRVRFGGNHLDVREHQEMERVLMQLEQSFNGNKSKR